MQIIGDFGRGISEAFKQVDKATQGVTSGTFTVTKDNVLAAARIIESQAEALHGTWQDASRDMNIEPPGSDDVSSRIAPAWNDRLVSADDSYANRVSDYI